MPEPSPTTANRLVFLDNLRYLFVIIVIMAHACNGYAGVTWLPVVDPGISMTTQMISGFLFTFCMPPLFFAAGYFALPSIRKKGFGSFMNGKLKRLGIPWLVCVLTVCPGLSLVYHATREGLANTQSFFAMWQEFMASILDFRVGIVSDLNQFNDANQFFQRYMWFVSLLVVLFFVFACVYALRKSWFQSSETRLAPVRQGMWSTLKLFVAVVVPTSFMSMGMVGLIRFFGPEGVELEPLFVFSIFLQFHPTRVFFYVIYFALGVLCYRNDWFGRGLFPGHMPTWLALFPLTTIGFLASFYYLHFPPPGLKEVVGLAYFLFVNLLCMSTVGLAVALAMRWWNRPRPFDRDMAAHSYNVYIAHYVYVVGLQAALLPLSGLSGVWKFLMVSAGATLLAYATSRLLIAPHPRLAVTTAFGLLMIMMLVF